jgi:hypothetical protein
VRTAPWVRETVDHYHDRGLAALGVHAPEFAHERDRAAVARNAEKLGLDFPHLVDPDFEYWRALDNQYWPTVYLVDRCGRIRGRRIGEIHAGEPSGRQVEARVRSLLAEDGDCEG